MGSVPIIEPVRLRWRLAPLAVLGAIVSAALVVVLIVVWPSGGGTGSVVLDAGRVEDLRAREPLYHEAGFFLVLLESGEVIALSETDPHRFGKDPDCPITWRPNMLFEGQAGWFRGKCSGTIFDLAGVLQAGPTLAPRGMDRFPVEVATDGGISADTSTPLCGPDHTVVACP